MDQNIAPYFCLCHSGSEAPKTLSELQALGSVTPLAGGLDTLALVGTQFSDALITTNNGAALLTGRGGYAAYQTTAMPLRISQRRVSLRVAPERSLQISRVNYEAQHRAGLVVSNAKGEICHRIETSDSYDDLIVHSLEAQDEAVKIVPPSSLPDGVVSLAAIRNACASWDDYDTGGHINGLMKDQGRSRRRALAHVGRNRAWPIAKQVICSFVTYLCDRQISHVRHVPGEGLVQNDCATSGEVSLIGNVLLLRSKDSTFALDLDQIGSAWVTKFGSISQLEMYGKDGRAIAVLAADPMANFSHWNTLLASLPLASYRGLSGVEMN